MTNTVASSEANSLCILVDTPSGPAALCMFKPASSFLTPSVDIFMFGIFGDGVDIIPLIVEGFSLELKTEEN